MPEKIISIRLSDEALKDLAYIKDAVSTNLKIPYNFMDNSKAIRYALFTLANQLKEENNKTTG